MVRRPLLSLIPAAALAFLFAMPLAGFGPAEARENPPRPDDHGGSDAVVSIQWVLRAEDLIACQTAAPQMRRAWHQYRERLRITTYLVGSDTALARSFLRRERLGSVQLVSISDEEFSRDFVHRLPATVSTPLVVVAAPHSAALAFEADVRKDAGRQGMEGMMARLNTVFQAPGPRLAALRVQTSRRSGGE